MEVDKSENLLFFVPLHYSKYNIFKLSTVDFGLYVTTVVNTEVYIML